jgi:hypothetical protein
MIWDVSPKHPIPACGIEWRAFTPFTPQTQGLSRAVAEKPVLKIVSSTKP